MSRAVLVEAPGRWRIVGVGVGGLTEPKDILDFGNAGTGSRLMMGVAGSHPITSTFDGDASLRKRPMRRILDPLTRMGAAIESQDGRPPLTIRGSQLRAIAHVPEVPSAQIKSAVLLAGLHASGTTVVEEPSPTRDHTERALDAFGVHVDRHGGRVAVEGGQRLSARALRVPGDISSATFWMALAAALPGSDLHVDNVGLNPTRIAVLEILRRAGARIEIRVNGLLDGEPAGYIRVAAESPRGFTIDPSEVPGVIDEIPALAALAALLPSGEVMEVRGAAELRVKESDRIACLARGLRAMGAVVDEYPDGFRLTAAQLRGATVDACGDHRLAMAFGVAACGASSPTTIGGASSVAISYPDFFPELFRLALSGDGR